ncbi:hypothetical protein D3C71_803050 [compost metagenome]
MQTFVIVTILSFNLPVYAIKLWIRHKNEGQIPYIYLLIIVSDYETTLLLLGCLSWGYCGTDDYGK